MAFSLVFSSHAFTSKELPNYDHTGFQRPPERSIPRTRNVRFRPCFNIRATQVSAGAEAISGPGHMEGQSLYEVLGISRGATARDIKRAYRKLAGEFHPDHATSTQEKDRNTQIFIRIHNAYVTLSDPHDRAQYERQLAGQLRGCAGQTWRKTTGGYRDWSGCMGRNWETDQCW